MLIIYLQSNSGVSIKKCLSIEKDLITLINIKQTKVF